MEGLPADDSVLTLRIRKPQGILTRTLEAFMKRMEADGQTGYQYPV